MRRTLPINHQGSGQTLMSSLPQSFRNWVESLVGPHSIDLMALDSNSQCHRHYTPYPTPLSTGVNFFAHNPCLDEHGRKENGYLFPPIYLIRPALQHLLFCKAKATLLVPDICPRPYWWPVLCRCMSGQYLLAQQGNREVLIWPSRQQGFHQPHTLPLPWNLWIFLIGNKQ